MTPDEHAQLIAAMQDLAVTAAWLRAEAARACVAAEQVIERTRAQRAAVIEHREELRRRFPPQADPAGRGCG